MEFSKILINAFLSGTVSFCVGYMLRARTAISAMGALLGALSYISSMMFSSVAAGFFVSAFVLALTSEIAAKIMKTPASIFIIIGIYPLVPGTGIYETFYALLRKSYEEALVTGVRTFVYLALIATAIALVSVFMEKISYMLRKKTTCNKV